MALLFIIAVGCNSNDEPKQDLAKFDWKYPGAKEIGYFVTDSSAEPFGKEDPIQIKLIEVRKRSDSSIVDSSVVSPKFLKKFLSNLRAMVGMDYKYLRKNSSGYMKFDYGETMLAGKPMLQVILKQDFNKAGLDSCMEFIKQLPAIDSVVYVSKEMAIERLKDVGMPYLTNKINTDFMPASLEVHIADRFLQIDTVKNFSNELAKSFYRVVQSISYTDDDIASYCALKNYFYIFHYKT